MIPCCLNTRYSYIEYTLYLRRRYTFYVMNVIVPCILLSILVMVGFCLPPDAGEKKRFTPNGNAKGVEEFDSRVDGSSLPHAVEFFALTETR